MTDSDRKRVIKELCDRLPYRSKIYISWDIENPREVKGLEYLHNPKDMCVKIGNQSGIPLNHIKLYLRKQSSMTPEELSFYNNEYNQLSEDEQKEWMNSHHFDTSNLIEDGFALEDTIGVYQCAE